MLTREEITAFCARHDYDVRHSHNGRWIDQKCAADVVTVIADCIDDFYQENGPRAFTSADIWHSAYAIRNVEDIFRKPGVEEQAARSEYNKFFQQPMEMLAAAGVLAKFRQGGRNHYRVADRQGLEYIALRERNALFFLQTYIEKVLADSGLLPAFEDFFRRQTQEAYDAVKDAFSSFTIRNTKINGVVECNRIFIKVLNPLAFARNCRGTEKGRLSEQVITYDMLMYNRNNFRDIYRDKPKGITRSEYAAAHPVAINEAYNRYQSARAKRCLRLFNDQTRGGLTEYPEPAHMADQAIHMHHIFPEAAFPDISGYVENLIALTPTQHLGYAHPSGRTQQIDSRYQHQLLLAKVDRIRESLADDGAASIYEFADLLYVLRVGLDDDIFDGIEDMDFDAVVRAIDRHYT